MHMAVELKTNACCWDGIGLYWLALRTYWKFLNVFHHPNSFPSAFPALFPALRYSKPKTDEAHGSFRSKKPLKSLNVCIYLKKSLAKRKPPQTVTARLLRNSSWIPGLMTFSWSRRLARRRHELPNVFGHVSQSKAGIFSLSWLLEPLSRMFYLPLCSWCSWWSWWSWRLCFLTLLAYSEILGKISKSIKLKMFLIILCQI